jgi:hypothetical protein
MGETMTTSKPSLLGKNEQDVYGGDAEHLAKNLDLNASQMSCLRSWIREVDQHDLRIAIPDRPFRDRVELSNFLLAVVTADNEYSISCGDRSEVDREIKHLQRQGMILGDMESEQDLSRFVFEGEL